MKVFIFISIFSLTSISVLSQKDTTIDNREYDIIERYSNNQIKLIGQYASSCLDTIQKKHGYFIYFDEEGNETDRELYFFDQRRNRKFLGIKYGWWGWYGMTTRYFMGIPTKKYIADPCF